MDANIYDVIYRTTFPERFLNKFNFINKKKIDKCKISEDEKRFEIVAEHFFSYLNVIQDLQKVIDFLKIIPDHILEYFPFLQNREEYYKYHYENYVLRMSTIPDLIGKLGNAIYNLQIEEKNCNAFKFKTKYSKLPDCDKRIVNSIEQILLFTENIREERHLKIHAGKTNTARLTNLNQQLLLTKVFEYDNDFEFKENFVKNISIEISELENQIIKLLEICNSFFEISSESILNYS